MLEIRPLGKDEIGQLETSMPRRAPGTHVYRWESQQRGESLYLIAWQNGVPVGHLEVRWAGTARREVARLLSGVPVLSDIQVHPNWQSQGIGSRLMDEAERLIAERGFARVGLSVATDNPRAQALYERRAYRDAGVGPYQSTWLYLDVAGQETWREETCVYLVKDLA